MGIKVFNPTTPGQRGKTGFTFEELTTDKPYKKLVRKLNKTGGRNNEGHITSRFIGGGHKRKYRIIDFKRNKLDIAGVIETIEYDPNRAVRISLIKYVDGDRKYILTPRVRCGVRYDSHVFGSKSQYPIQESEPALDTLLAPLQVPFRRSGKKTEQPGCIGAILV